MSGQVSDKTAYEKLAKFASAMARGATIEMTKATGSTGKTCRLGLSGDCVDATYFAEYADIKEIIEPKVLRDWTAEDAKKHVGFAWRSDKVSNVYILRAEDANFRSNPAHGRGEYAAPIPGTDPAKWDWKPCKVEVPAEKAILDVAATLRGLRGDILTGNLSTRPFADALTEIVTRLDRLVLEMEQS